MTSRAGRIPIPVVGREASASSFPISRITRPAPYGLLIIDEKRTTPVPGPRKGVISGIGEGAGRPREKT